MENAELVILVAGGNAVFSFLAWKQRAMEVRLKCEECDHLGQAHNLVCRMPQRFNLNEDCFFCGRPLLGEIVFA